MSRPRQDAAEMPAETTPDIAAIYEANMRAHPERAAYVAGAVTMTWGQVHTTTDGLLAALADVPADAVIGVLARTRPAMVASFVRLFIAGRGTIMMHAFQPRLALIAQLREKRLATLIADVGDIDPELEAFAREAGMRLIAIGIDAARAVVSGGPWQPGDYLADDAGGGVTLLTSGTTGAPKHIALPRNTIAAAARNWMLNNGFGADGTAGPADFVSFLTFPLGNITGVYLSIPNAVVGATLCLLERFTVEGYMEIVRRHPQTTLALPPIGVKMLLEAGLPRDTFRHALYANSGATLLDPAIQAAFEDYFGLPILLAYGATEFGGIIVIWTLDDHARFARAKRGSTGRAIPGVRLRVVDPETGVILPTGQDGRLEAQVDRMGPDWISTNDIAMIDEDGFVFIRGRADDVIVRGGFKIDPETINTALRQHPAISEAETIGRPDERLGQVPITAVVLRPGHEAEPEALRAWLRERLVAYALPVEIHRIEALPRNPSLKVDKRELARMLGSAG